MENLIKRGMTSQYAYYFRNWGYFFNAGYLAWQKSIWFNSNELIDTQGINFL